MKNVALNFFLLPVLLLASVSHGMADIPRMKDTKEYSLYFNKLLPFGTSRVEIEHLLKKEKLEYSFTTRNACINAIIRDAAITGVVNKNVQLVFQLDEMNNLKFICVKVIYTGP